MTLKHAALTSLVLLTALVTLVTMTTMTSGQQPPADWPQWRGPNRDAAGSLAVPATWPDQLTQKWKVTVGLGYATPLVVGNRIYMFSRQGADEVMTALDPTSGMTVWQTKYAAPITMHSAAVRHGDGPKSTPAFANGRLYSIGTGGIVTSFDVATGRQVWQKPGAAAQPMFTNNAFSPIVDRGMVIIHIGGHNQGALTAFDANTGDVKWQWTGDGPGYGSPIIADLGGAHQI